MSGILLINQATRRELFLGYPEAMIWQMLADGQRNDRILESFEIVSGLTLDEARQRLFQVLEAWKHAGWLE